MQGEGDDDCQNDSCRNNATLESDKQTMKTIAVFIKVTHIGTYDLRYYLFQFFLIVCPNCECSFELDPAGCDHFHCTNCQYDFCRFCKKPFKQGKVCCTYVVEILLTNMLAMSGIIKM